MDDRLWNRHHLPCRDRWEGRKYVGTGRRLRVLWMSSLDSKSNLNQRKGGGSLEGNPTGPGQKKRLRRHRVSQQFFSFRPPLLWVNSVLDFPYFHLHYRNDASLDTDVSLINRLDSKKNSHICFLRWQSK